MQARARQVPEQRKLMGREQYSKEQFFRDLQVPVEQLKRYASAPIIPDDFGSDHNKRRDFLQALEISDPAEYALRSKNALRWNNILPTLTAIETIFGLVTKISPIDDQISKKREVLQEEFEDTILIPNSGDAFNIFPTKVKVKQVQELQKFCTKVVKDL